MLSQDTSSSKDAFLSPRSIAIIGASEKPGVGKAIFSNIINGYKGRVYPINPSSTTVSGLKAYKSVLDIAEDIDLAVIATPNKSVPVVMEEVGKKKITCAIIVSAGFKEVDEQGAELEKQVAAIGKKYGIRIIGPNCLGIMSLSQNNMMNATFLKITPKYGGIALVSQSGAICAATVEDAVAQGIGFSKVISMGNKADVDENDILEFLAQDPETRVIVMYLEDIHDGRRFMQIAKKITKQNEKPIIVLKAGRTPEGAKAAMSHTGALMGADEIYDALFIQSGVIRVDTMQDLFELSTAFSKQPIPERDSGVVIVSNAGGPAIISTDSCSKYGLKMADISSSQEVITKVIPHHGSARNPVDIVGDADFYRFEMVLNEVLANRNVGAVVSMCTPSATLDYNELARTIVKISRNTPKTMLAALMGLAEGIENKKILSEGGVPHFEFAEPAIKTLYAMYRFRDWLASQYGTPKQFDVDKEKVRNIFDNVRSQNRTNLLEEEGYEVITAYGLAIPKSILGTTEEQCVQAAKEIGYPVVMKIASRDIIHKSDAGGVRVGLKNEDEVRNGFKTIMENSKKYRINADIKGVLVQEMIKSAKEIILGAKMDPLFGPLLMIGLGGIYVEVLKDVVFRLAPVDEKEAIRMVDSIKAVKLLKGVRGEKPSDIQSIAESLQRLSQLITDFPEIEELDMNPLLVLEEGKGSRAVDIRIGLKNGNVN
ncbi:MAG TPA: acetate--CoA ligase family protein [Nitrososphaeraceae archaeon]|jgi:4-hydroxybutyryl-CoA synthetase (ADP-forming)|nr:acetate--CoA ligase family protein [Nitrososphaeraceae archaeon]